MVYNTYKSLRSLTFNLLNITIYSLTLKYKGATQND
jgi:hypothetical protein